MKIRIFLIVPVLLVISCNTNSTAKDQTKRTLQSALKFEDTIKLPIKAKFAFFSYFSSDSGEFLGYEDRGFIYVANLMNRKIEDSISVPTDTAAINKYGALSSFCFSVRDSLFVLFDQALIFFEKKKIKTIIPINRHDTLQYKTIRFENIEDVPIYYDKSTKSVIGEVYCSECWQTGPAFYRQKMLGSLSVESGKISLFNITFPKKYIEDYYGFDNKPYAESNDSFTLISFPCDDMVYVLNREADATTQFPGRSIYQSIDAQPFLPLADSESIEKKMRHMTVEPYYAEIRFDKARQLYYRFFLKDIPLKNEDGTYNDFYKKQLILMVFNSQHEVIGEYKLHKYYNRYISFVGKSGLYMQYISPNVSDRGSTVFKILTFK